MRRELVIVWALCAASLLGCSSRGEGAPAPEPQKGTDKATVATAPAAQQQAQAKPQLTADEETVLGMYDAIAVAFEKHPDDCDAMGGELDAIVERSTPDVKRWADAQTRLDSAARSAAGNRLQAAAGSRIERAQTAIRTAMGKCPDSARFQAALSKLTALSPEE